MKKGARILRLVLKRKWYDMIASGEKKEEYRELTDYWEKRLWEVVPGMPMWNKRKAFDAVTFYLGYRKDRPQMTFRWAGCEIGRGRPEWGAEPGKDYFVIKLGERL